MQILGKILLLVAVMFCNFDLASAKIASRRPNSKNLFFKTDDDIRLKLSITDEDLKTFNQACKLLLKNDWVEALSWADSIKSENLKDATVDYVLWKKYSGSGYRLKDTDFNDLLIFIQTHEYLPNINSIKTKAENMYLNNNIPYQFVEEYFKKVKPVNTRTAVKILKDRQKIIEKNDKNFSDAVVKVFYDYDFNNVELNDFLANFNQYLNEKNYIQKVRQLLWNNEFAKAQPLISRLSTANRILYSGIIQINTNPKYINNILRSVPQNLREDELLLFTRFKYYHKNKKNDDAIKILMSMKSNMERPDKWWKYYMYYSRDMIKKKDYKRAYFFAINNNIPKTSPDYSESQWLAGWIALEFLKKPKDAYFHFYNMYNAVSYPISKSRAAYWAGRAMEANNNQLEAVKWYNIGASYPLYFYGQLSFHSKNELLAIPSLMGSTPLPSPEAYSKLEENNALNNDAVKLAYLMVINGDNKNHYTDLFKYAINNAKTKGEISAIFEIIKNTEDDELITKMAKYLTYKDVYFVDNLFPVLNIINLENPNSHLVHSIIKQESGFHVSAKSPVGATGFMQLMPATAKEVAKRMKLKYNPQALKSNPAYNILLGSYYINSLISQFDGNQVLAIASYNAGPNAVKRWIEDYGDPRKMENINDIINWIELIGYSETRNYVQRIVEGSIVYEYMLEKSNNAIKNKTGGENEPKE